MTAVREYEMGLGRAMLVGLQAVDGLTLHGITDVTRLDRRVPTFSFTLDGWHPRKICEELDKEGIAAWDGNYYAPEVTTRLGLEDKGGMVRVGAVHYNTYEEVQKLVTAVGAHCAPAPAPVSSHGGGSRSLGRRRVRPASEAQLGLGKGADREAFTPGNESVLDIGCGDGKVTAEIARLLPRGEAVGIDSSEDMVRKARSAFPTVSNPRLSFQLMDARSLAFEKGSTWHSPTRCFTG